MNITNLAPRIQRIRYRIRLHSRFLALGGRCNAFDENSAEAIQRIYVINLDRQPKRWLRMKRELDRFKIRSGYSLTSIVRRVSAVDARHHDGENDAEILTPTYSLADQLAVQPHALLQVDETSKAHKITMSVQERAVALSHIDVWRKIATGNAAFTLVLEDDIYFVRGFARKANETWTELMSDKKSSVDLLYLSYLVVNDKAAVSKIKSGAEKAPIGVWYASGYVLSKDGAKKLLDMLPVYGPVDLWLNLHLEKLSAFRSRRPLIEQRIDSTSTNSYSIMPLLTRLGVYNFDSPEVFPKVSLPGPIFVSGPPNSGLTSIASALSIVGYTCCSDFKKIPASEMQLLGNGSKNLRFNAYINVGEFSDKHLEKFGLKYPEAKFIFTKVSSELTNLGQVRCLTISKGEGDKWKLLSEFLGMEYPAHPFPEMQDIGLRQTKIRIPTTEIENSHHIKHDQSPWSIQSPGWDGICLEESSNHSVLRAPTKKWDPNSRFTPDNWLLRTDTFPSNLALFSPRNVQRSSESAELILREEVSPFRSFSSAAIASVNSYTYGTFCAELKPSGQSGVITGMFLHRNGPRQEIDIEFLGNDTTSMLVNVYFNPGLAGTKLEYGYRGNPHRVDLDFDASNDFHRYEIEWGPSQILWKVDGHVVHKRVLWDPTPIPNLPLEFNINLWTSRSVELAGKLDAQNLPTSSNLRLIEICGQTSDPAHNNTL